MAAVGLFVGVTIHELGHSWVAMRYGPEIESVTLWIFGGLAALKTFPKEWNREFWSAIAGPITSFLVAVGCYGAVLAGFNLLPAFPMDGGRILRALLARSRPYVVATRIAARVGVLFAIVVVLDFQIVLLLLLAFFIYGTATTESKAVLLDEPFEGLTVGDIMTREPATVAPSTT